MKIIFQYGKEPTNVELRKFTGRALPRLPMHAETLDCMDLGVPGNVGTVKLFNKNTICQPAANPPCNFFSSFFDPGETFQGMLSDKNKPLIYRV